jgi:Xaa-Pro aminopeptidase
MSHPTAERLNSIRALMRENNIDFYFIPSRDEHNDEYLPECWQRRAYISGFTGSAGDVLIGLNDAYLWTDPRYTLQAEQQLNADCFTLMGSQQGMAAPIHKWLIDNAADKRVGTDPRVMTVTEKKLWKHSLKSVNGELVSVDENLVDAIWDDRPALQHNPILVLEEKYSGKSTKQKLKELREQLKEQKAEAHAINLLDAIAWLFNIRGSDIDYNPLAISYALVTLDEATFFISDKSLNDEIRAYLVNQGITVKPYDEFAEALQQVKTTTLLESSTASWWMKQNLKNAELMLGDSPITLMKAIKNTTEQDGAREAHRRDAIALCKIFYWLENNWQGQTEMSVFNKVEECRAEEPLYRGPSFNTISSYAEHGAINHYAVSEETNIPIGDKTPFLLDSGAQYPDGTTDVTRTVHFGTPSADIIRQYTLVLKGHLQLRHTVFPHGTCGEQLNPIAHQPLWSEGLDFSHGTGHGVGSYLCVHEGPQRISGAYTRAPIVPGMIVSNEPGFYIGGSHGFRIENLVLTVPKFTVAESKSGHGPFYTFEDLTLLPYARNMIDKSILTAQEIEWVDEYHQMVYAKLHADLPKDIQSWLHDATRPL